MIPKPQRIVNKALCESYIGKSCPIPTCLRQCSYPHHIKSRGAGGDDVEENLIALCLPHHAECHGMGRKAFYKRYRTWIPEINRKAFER